MNAQGFDKEDYYLVEPPPDFSVRALVEAKATVEKALSKGHKYIAFNLAQCTFMDSSTIGLLNNLHKKCKQKGGWVSLISPTEPLRELFEVTNINSVLNVYGTYGEFESDLFGKKRTSKDAKAKSEINKKSKK